MPAKYGQPHRPQMPGAALLEAKRAALRHYGSLVLLTEDQAAGRRSRRLQSSFAGIGLSDNAVRLYVYDSAPTQPELVTHFNGFPTEVVRTPGFRAAPATRRRPAPAGVSIGLHYQHTAGTLGRLLQNRQGDRYLLSNNHVIADLNAAPLGSPIIQPAKPDGGISPDDDIAVLAAFHRIDVTGENRVDAAVAALPDPGVAEAAALGIGTFVNPPVAAFVGQTVHKHGRTTARTAGAVVDPSFNGFVDYGPAGLVWFEDQVVIHGTDGPFSAAGDSGALIVNDGRHPVALLFAGDDRHTVANPIDVVLDAFGMAVL